MLPVLLGGYLPWPRFLEKLFRNTDGFVYDPLDPASLLLRRNQFTESEFRNGVSDAPTRGGLVSATTLTGFAGALAFGHDGVTGSYAYKTNFFTVIGKTYTLSVFVQMTDGLAPSFGSASIGNVLNDFGIVISNSIPASSPITYAVSLVPGSADVYRVSATVTAQVASTNNGIIKYATNSSRTFKVTGYQIELGSTATEYQPVTDWTTEYTAAVGALVGQWQESTGVTPITVTETACGLRLDERFTGIRGAELGSGAWLNTFATAFDTFSSSGPTGFTATEGGAGAPRTLVAASITAGRSYEVSFTPTFTGISSIAVWTANGSYSGLEAQGSATVSGTPYRRIIVATGFTATHLMLIVNCSGAATVAVTGLTIKEIPGNHTLQATSAARPVMSARYNLLTKSDQFDDAAWSKTDTTVTANQAVAPDGTTSMDLLTEGVAGTAGCFQTTTIPSGAGAVGRLTLKRGNHDWVRIIMGSSDATTAAVNAFVNLATGAIGTVSAIGAATGIAATSTDEGGGIYTVRVSAATLPGATTVYINTRSASADNSATRVNNATRYQWGADLRTADDAAKSIPAYQYVNTATDMATDGFPAYEKFDGTDDSRTSATGGGSTTGFFWCGVVTVLGGAGAARELWADNGTNTGVILRLASTNALQLSIGNGATYPTALTAANSTVVGTTYVFTAYYDGTTVAVQINNDTPVTAPMVGTLSAGGAGFQEGRAAAAAVNFFNGRMYGRVYTKNYCPSAPERERIKRYLAAKAGFIIP